MNKPTSLAAGSALRQRFVEDMTVLGFSEKTRRYYIRIVAGFATFLAARRTPPRPKIFAGSRFTSRSLGCTHRR
jgi:hypothetical protein